MGTKNTKGVAGYPPFGTEGQRLAGNGNGGTIGKGGPNRPASPFGQSLGKNNTRNHAGQADPRHGVTGQRLANEGNVGGGATGIPTPYRTGRM